MECVIKAHLSGAEVCIHLGPALFNGFDAGRIHVGPALYYHGFDATPADAEARAATLKEALLADGWMNGDASGSLVFSKAPIDVDTHATNRRVSPLPEYSWAAESTHESQSKDVARPSPRAHLRVAGRSKNWRARSSGRRIMDPQSHLRGQLSFNHASSAAPDAASQQAVNLKRVLLADGSDRPVMTGGAVAAGPTMTGDIALA